MLAYIGLGSNLGDRLGNLQAALNFLDLRAGDVLRASRVFETAPMYITDQPHYLNAVAEIETHLEPAELLSTVKSIEEEIGRIPRERYGPREIDIDILATEPPANLRTEGLTVPHSKIAERRFVLEPLSELDPRIMVTASESVHDALQKESVQAQDVRVLEDGFLSIHRD